MEYNKDRYDTVGIYRSDVMKEKEKTKRKQYGKISLQKEEERKRYP